MTVCSKRPGCSDQLPQARMGHVPPWSQDQTNARGTRNSRVSVPLRDGPVGSQEPRTCSWQGTLLLQGPGRGHHREQTPFCPHCAQVCSHTPPALTHPCHSNRAAVCKRWPPACIGGASLRPGHLEKRKSTLKMASSGKIQPFRNFLPAHTRARRASQTSCCFGREDPARSKYQGKWGSLLALRPP